jgi:uncharacterized membrane protein
MAEPGGHADDAAVLHRDEAGIEFSRIVAFSDGVFAIAITLLVLTLQIPSDAADLDSVLGKQHDDLFAYALSFAVIGKFWVSHHRFYGALDRFDNRLMWLNLLYLAWVALVPFSSDLLGNYGEEPVAVIIYAANMAGASLTFSIQIAYAYRRGLARDGATEQRRYAGPANYILGGVFLLSMPVALVNTFAAQAMWLLVFATGRRAADRLARIGA